MYFKKHHIKHHQSNPRTTKQTQKYSERTKNGAAASGKLHCGEEKRHSTAPLRARVNPTVHLQCTSVWVFSRAERTPFLRADKRDGLAKEPIPCSSVTAWKRHTRAGRRIHQHFNWAFQLCCESWRCFWVFDRPALLVIAIFCGKDRISVIGFYSGINFNQNQTYRYSMSTLLTAYKRCLPSSMSVVLHIYSTFPKNINKVPCKNVHN